MEASVLFNKKVFLKKWYYYGMDIFAHGLWAGASYKALQRNSKRPINVWMATFWGVIPDFFAFSLPFAFMLWSVVFGGMSLGDFRGHTRIEPVAHQFPLYDLTNSLYNLSHSLIIFFIVFGLVWAIRKIPLWELGGWFIHILIDIPTHSYQFFPTPFLWPLSNLKINGFSWGTPWFMILNYGSLAALYIVLFSRHKFKDPTRVVFGVLALLLIVSFAFAKG